MSGQPFEHPAPAKHPDAIKSFTTDAIEALAEVERLWAVIAANGATNSRLMCERVKVLAEVAQLKGDAHGRALATIERVKALHAPVFRLDARVCVNDNRSWPCPTIRAIEEPS